MVSKSCIFYLVNDSPIHLKRLGDSLDCLRENFLRQYPYPIVFGHEGMSQGAKDQISSHLGLSSDTSLTHWFVDLKFEVPPYDASILNQIPAKFKGHWDEHAFFSMGYRHMCRFFAGDIYRHPSFENVRYMMRLDCDSYFQGPVFDDPFHEMADNEFLYGTIGTEDDMEYVVEGLHEFTSKYFGHDIGTLVGSSLGMFKTHFEIADFQWFKNGPYMKFFEAIDKTGNIYIKRWGDAPIKYQGIMNLVASDEIKVFDLPYRHGGDL